MVGKVPGMLMCDGNGEEVLALWDLGCLCLARPLHCRRPIDEDMGETLHSDTVLPPVTPRIRTHEPKGFVSKVVPFSEGRTITMGENGRD